jgi:hypothetical protein
LEERVFIVKTYWITGDMNKPRTLDELRENIRREIQMVTPEVLAATSRHMQRRVQLCIDAQGGHFQHLL